MLILRTQERFQQKPPLGARLDVSHPITKGLVDLWLFEPGSGQLKDQVTSIPTSSSKPAPSSLSKAGPGRQFSSGEFFDGDVAKGVDGEGYTVWAYCVPEDFAAFRNVLDSDDSGSSRQFQLRFEQTAGKQTFLVFNTAGSFFSATAATGAAANEKNQIAGVVTWDGAQALVYSNGRQVGSAAITGTVRNSFARMRIGRRLAGDLQRFKGAVVLAARWKRQLLESELKLLVVNPYVFFAPMRSAKRFTLKDRKSVV